MRILLIALGLTNIVLGQGQVRRPQPPDPQKDERQKSIESIIAAIPDNCEITPEPAAVKNAALHFYPPFAPSDTIYDAWCKLQSFKSGQPVKAFLVTKEGSFEILHGDYAVDGTVHETKASLAKVLVPVIASNNGPNFWRATYVMRQGSEDVVPRPLPTGVPAAAPEANYTFYYGSLQLELQDVEIMGLKFTVGITFDPDSGLIPKHFAKTAADYLHVPMAITEQSQVRTGDCPQCFRNVSTLKTREVGFPWVLKTVTFQSTDDRVGVATPEIKKSIKDKYAKWIKKNDVTEPHDNDPLHKVTEISDGLIFMMIHEGTMSNWTQGDTATRKAKADSKYLQIMYQPVVGGPLGVFDTNAFNAFIKQATDRYNKSVTDSVKGKNPF